MTLQIVPTGAEAFYDETVTLDGTAYILSFNFNQICACWYLDLATIDGELVAPGLKLVCNWDLLLKSASPLRPPGTLIVCSNTTDDSTPGLNDLLPGGRCYLVYAPIADLVAQAKAAASAAA